MSERKEKHKMLNRSYRVVKDIEALGGGFIRGDLIEKRHRTATYKGTVYFGKDKHAAVMVRYEKGYGTIIGPDEKDRKGYEELSAYLDAAEADLTTGYKRKLIFRERVDNIERKFSIWLTLLLMWFPVNRLVSLHNLETKHLIITAIWFAGLIIINKTAWYLRRK